MPKAEPAELRRRNRNLYVALAVVAGLAVVAAFLVSSGAVALNLQDVATAFGHFIILLTILFFAYLIFSVAWSGVFLVLWITALAILVPFLGFDLGASWASGATLVIFIASMLVYLAARQTRVSMEKRRLMVIFWLFLLVATFWSGFEQAGSSMNLFAERLTDRYLGPLPSLGMFAFGATSLLALAAAVWISYHLWKRKDLFLLEKTVFSLVTGGLAVFASWIAYQVIGGWEIPTGWLQNVNPTFIVIFAPIFGWLWTWLARQRANPSIPVKFSLGLLGLAAGFFVLAWGAANATPESPVSMSWLVVTYFLHTVGELCLSPVGLSSMTKLAPAGRVGQMMGVWFIGAALGNLIAGLVAGLLENLSSQQLYWMVAIIIGGVGFLALLLSPLVRKLMGHVE